MKPQCHLSHARQLTRVERSGFGFDRFLPPFFVIASALRCATCSGRRRVLCPGSVRLACCTHGVAFSRQQVVLPGGQAYWTVLDEAFEVAEPFDGFFGGCAW